MKIKVLMATLFFDRPEEEILGYLKIALEKTPQLPKKLTWNDQSLLEKAAWEGYTSILRYFIEEKGADPKDSYRPNPPIMFAISNNKTEAASYLLSKMLNTSKEQLLAILRLLVNTRQARLIKEILDANSDLIEYQTSLVLEEAIYDATDEIVLMLLQRGANKAIFDSGFRNYSPYYAVLEMAKKNILPAMLEFGADPLQSTFEPNETSVTVDASLIKKKTLKRCEADIMQTPLQILAKSTQSTADKRECANILLSVGAGLNIDNIPEKIFELYKLQRNIPTLGPFLIIAEEKQKDNTWKKRIVTKISQLEKYITSPNWRFNTQQLLKACSHSLFSELEHVSQIRYVIESNCTAAENLTSSVLKDSLQNRPLNSLTAAELQTLSQEVFSQFSEQKSLLIAAIHDLVTNNTPAEITAAFEKTFKLYSTLMDILKNKHGDSIVLKEKATLESILISEFQALESDVSQYLQALLPQSRDNAKRQILNAIANPFQEECKLILKKHKSFLLKEEHKNLHSRLLDSKIILDLALTEMYYKIKKFNMALYCVIDAQNSLNNLLDFDILSLTGSAKSQVSVYLWLAAIYHRQGCYSEATLQLQKARELTTSDDILAVLSSIILLHTITAHKDTNIVTNDLILLYQQVADQFSLCKQDLIPDITKATMESFNITLKLMRAKYVNDATDALTHKIGRLGVASCDPLTQTITLILSKEAAFSNLSIEAITLLTNTAGVHYTPSMQKIDFNEAFLFSSDYAKWLDQFVSATKNTVLKQSAEFDIGQLLKLTEDLSHLKFANCKEKVKTRSKVSSRTNEGDTSQDIKESNQLSLYKSQLKKKRSHEKTEEKAPVDKYGFTQLEGYSPSIPVVSNFIPEETLFIAIPNNDPRFLPFLNLSHDKKSDNYHEIRSVSEKGHNQQGVKLGSKLLTSANEPPVKIDIARVKVLGADGKGKLRATGQVQQEINTQDNRTRKLYVIDEVVDKKEEKRKKLLK